MQKRNRKRLWFLLVWAFLILGLCACGAEKDDDDRDDKKDKKDKKEKEIEYSDNILISLNYGAAGFGTRADCTDAEMYVYTDGTLRVTMYIEGEETELGAFVLTEEDFERVQELADRDEIYDLKVKENMDVCDGNSTHMTLYDEDDEELITKGGYMPEGKKFWEIYKGIREILVSYDVERLVEGGRSMIDFYDAGGVVDLEAFAENNMMLLNTWVIHTACCFTPCFGDINEMDGYDICNILQAIYTLDGGSCTMETSIPMDEVMRLFETYTFGYGYTEENIKEKLEDCEYGRYNAEGDSIDFYPEISDIYGNEEFEYSLLPNGYVQMMVYWTESDWGDFTQRFVFTNDRIPRLVEYELTK